MPLLLLIADNFSQLARFALSGLLSAGVNYGTLYLFILVLSGEIIASTTIAFAVSTLVGFVLQKYWTFGGKKNGAATQAALYLLLAVMTLLANDGLLYALADVAKLNFLAAQTIATIVLGLAGMKLTWRLFAPSLEKVPT